MSTVQNKDASGCINAMLRVFNKYIHRELVAGHNLMCLQQCISNVGMDIVYPCVYMFHQACMHHSIATIKVFTDLVCELLAVFMTWHCVLMVPL